MGVFFDYFAAPGDDEAAATIDRPLGPGGPPATVRRGGVAFGRFRRAQDDGSAAGAYPTIADTGIDPVVQGGTLEELLTGRPYEELERDPQWGRTLATRNGGERLVTALTDHLTHALAAATPEELAAAAAPWSQTEEFWGRGDPQELADLLVELAQLARDARVRGDRLYCWTSL
jgi:hypothetical protein